MMSALFSSCKMGMLMTMFKLTPSATDCGWYGTSSLPFALNLDLMRMQLYHISLSPSANHDLAIESCKQLKVYYEIMAFLWHLYITVESCGNSKYLNWCATDIVFLNCFKNPTWIHWKFTLD